jgi:hypothetical protein
MQTVQHADWWRSKQNKNHICTTHNYLCKLFYFITLDIKPICQQHPQNLSLACKLMNRIRSLSQNSFKNKSYAEQPFLYTTKTQSAFW